MPTFAHTLSSI